MNFTTKLLFLSLGAVLGVTIPLYLFLSHTSSQALEQEIRARLHGQAVDTMDKLDRMLFERRADMQLIANIISRAATPTPAQLTQSLLVHRRYYKAYYSLSFYNARGIRIADTAGLSLGQMAEASLWTTTVFERGGASIGEDIHFDADLQKNIVYFAVPVQNDQGTLLGAVVARMSVENLYYVLGGLEDETERLEVSLFDATGKMLYSTSEPQLIGKSVLSAVTSEQIAAHFGQETFYQIAPEQGYLDFKGNQWTLVMHYPAKEALAAVTRLRVQAFLIGLTLILLALAVTTLMARHLVKPVLQLKEAALKLGRGEFQTMVIINSKDEIGQLAHTFNQMAQRLLENMQALTQKEELLKGYNQRLEEEVSTQTEELAAANEELQAHSEDLWHKNQLLEQAKETAEQARRQADLANQAKSAFLANMSHELRTPLNGILGYTQILGRDKSLTSKQQDGIGVIHRSGEYLLTLINDVLDLAKIEAGKIELYPIDFNFKEFIQGLTELFRMRAQQKGIVFIYEPLSHLPLGVHADEKRLRQVLINLLGNAVKFTQQGGVTLKIGYHNEKIRFQIEDTGAGIAPADMDKIFQPFQQVGDSQYKAEGTGLGLPITKKLVTLMGGELYVESTLGQGSIFWMALDLPDVSNLITAQTIQEPIIIGIAGEVSPKILVIDDKWENRSVMDSLLTPLGFTIVEASNGQEGLEKAREMSPDLIITDLVMPVMDGFEVTRQLRQQPRFETLPIIAASASVFDYHQQQSKIAGCDDFLAKPFRAEILLGLLQKHLKLTWRYEEASSQIISEVITAAEEDMEVNLSSQQAADLYKFAIIGDIGGILEAVDELDATDTHLRPFNNKVRQLAKQFEEKQICELIERYL